MRYLISLILCFSLLFFACKDAAKQDATANGETNTPKVAGQSTPRSKHSYRRYTGAIAGQPVVVNLSVQKIKTEDGKDGYTAFGTYYYPGKSQVIDLTIVGEAVRGDSIRLTEALVANAEEPIGATWDVQVSEQGLKGKWTSEDKKRTYDISLDEQYEDGAYPFDLLDVNDSFAVQGKEDRYTMQTDFSLLVPTSKWKAEDAQFVEQQLLKELNKDTALGGKTIAEFVKLKNRQLFGEYNTTVTENLKRDEGGASFNNHNYSMINTCDYNSRGMVVLTLSTLAYMGGAHGSYWTRYFCLDVRDRKVWQLGDIIKVDTAALGRILDQKLRISYDIKPGEKLSKTFLYDTIPPAENVALSDVGITLYYNPYEIGPYVMGPVAVFITFKELKAFLRPEFKTRWGL